MWIGFIFVGKADQEGMITAVLLLLSRFRRVRLCATPETAAHQALGLPNF